MVISMDMATISVKRDPLKARAPNFTPRDETILVTLVRKYRDILQCKKSDSSTNSSKIATWQKLELEFNSICGGTYRNSRVLKNKYENIKKRNRARLAAEKQEIYVSEAECQQHEESNNSGEDLLTLTQLHEGKEDLANMEIRCLLEEHQLKLQHMQEKHDKTLMIQDRESKQRMQLLEEEHRIKVEILRSQQSKVMSINGSFSIS